MCGKPFYDMLIFNNNSRYPGALPDPLRSQPGGLCNYQLLVYEAFQRMPHQPSNVGTTQQSNATYYVSSVPVQAIDYNRK